MALFKGKKNKQVVVYSAGRDGSTAVYDSLSVSAGIAVRQVYTLDREKIEAMKTREDGDVPPHILESDKILREDMARDVPHYFITMVHEPFMRHVRQCFYQLQMRVDASALGLTLSNTNSILEYFYENPATNSSEWFENEFLPATGINVFKHAFDKNSGFQIYTLGIHKFLLLSAHLTREEKTSIISNFLETKIAPVLDETSPLDGLRDLLAMQVLTNDRTKVQSDFWDTPYVRHFFAPEQLSKLQAQYDEASQRVLETQDTVEQIKSSGARAQLLTNALSQMQQVQHLTAEISILANKRGADTIANVVDGVLKQLERAHNNLLLSAMRAFSTDDVKRAIAIGDNWIDKPTDERIIKSMSAYLQRDSAIKRPLALIETVRERDEKLEAERQSLLAQAKLLDESFAFTPVQKLAFTPAPKTILYNPHQCLPYHTSGYATRTQGIIKGLAKDGWSMKVFARAGYPADTGVAPGPDATREIDGIPYRYDLTPGRGQRDLPLDQYIDQAAAYLVGWAHAVKPNIIHTASNFMCGLAGVEAARRLGLPSIYEMRGLWHITRWSKEPDYASTDKFALAQKMELAAAEAADHVLAITGALKEWLVEHGIEAGKISLAPNAVDLAQFAVREPDIEFARNVGCEGKIVVGYIGSFVQYEGLDLLVEAVAHLPRDLQQKIRLLWIGDGPVLPELLELAKTLGVSESIISLGRRPFEEVPRAYSIVDISAFPRKGQAICEIVSPLKPFEAMAMKKAVIASDVRPLKEIIEHGVTGLTHRKDDARSLAEQLERFVNDPALRQSCGENARAWIEKTRQWDIIARNISSVYKTLI